MTDKSKDLSTHIVSPEAKGLAMVRERGLITDVQEKQITVATADALSLVNSAAFRRQANPLERHSSFVDNMMHLVPGGSSVITRARECLADVHETWESIRPEFHKYKTLFYKKNRKEIEAKHLAKAIKKATDDDDRELMDADLNIMLAEIEEMEAEISYGEQKIRTAMEASSEASSAYALILKESGKESFTKKDFEEEELEYFLVAAFWHASNTFTVLRHTRNRNMPERIQLDEDAYMFMESLGIYRRDIEDDIKNLRDQKKAFDGHNGDQPQSFVERHRAWLTTMAKKHLGTAKSKVAEVGYARVRKIGEALSQTFEKGTDPTNYKKIDNRDGVTR